jgi:hypothetical protein
MSYNSETIQKKYDGSILIPLTVEAEILAKRKVIEDMTIINRGADLELIHQAYKEIKNALGQHVSKLDSSCSGCVIRYKKTLVNWFGMHDKQGHERIDLSKVATTPLVPIDPMANDFQTMTKEFYKVATDQEKATINDGKKPTKAQLNEYFETKA